MSRKHDVLYTGRTHTCGGRQGSARSDEQSPLTPTMSTCDA